MTFVSSYWCCFFLLVLFGTLFFQFFTVFIYITKLNKTKTNSSTALSSHFAFKQKQEQVLIEMRRFSILKLNESNKEKYAEDEHKSEKFAID